MTELYYFLESAGEKQHDDFENFLFDYKQWKTYRFAFDWTLSLSKEGTEVTIQQLKEILQPMENTKFKKDDVIIITDFGRVTSSTHTTNFTLNKPYVLEKDFNKENGLFVKIDDNNNKRNGWRNAFDLGIKIELYKEPTLTEQLEKAEAEVKRLKEAIEEESKPKDGDICVMDNGDYKFIKIFYNDECFIDSLKIKKIQDQELINKLNELIK